MAQVLGDLRTFHVEYRVYHHDNPNEIYTHGMQNIEAANSDDAIQKMLDDVGERYPHDAFRVELVDCIEGLGGGTIVDLVGESFINKIGRTVDIVDAYHQFGRKRYVTGGGLTYSEEDTVDLLIDGVFREAQQTKEEQVITGAWDLKHRPDYLPADRGRKVAHVLDDIKQRLEEQSLYPVLYFHLARSWDDETVPAWDNIRFEVSMGQLQGYMVRVFIQPVDEDERLLFRGKILHSMKRAKAFADACRVMLCKDEAEEKGC